MQADISSHECGLLAPSLEDYAELQIKYPYVFRSLPDSMVFGKSFGRAPEVGIIKPAHAHRHTVDCDSDIDADGETESETSSDSSFTLSSSVDGDASDDEYIPSPCIKNRSIRTRIRARAPAKPRTRSSPYPRSNASSSRSASPRNSPSREPSSGPQRGPIGPRPRNMQSAPVHVAPHREARAPARTLVRSASTSRRTAGGLISRATSSRTTQRWTRSGGSAAGCPSMTSRRRGSTLSPTPNVFMRGCRWSADAERRSAGAMRSRGILITGMSSVSGTRTRTICVAIIERWDALRMELCDDLTVRISLVNRNLLA
ncbi:hypothetical protein A0H81_08396 [Grifola frondosa]|uniref:Uncharacterized protein n=1 Tax=Grifola frondosa TaxID=5627 RepID=A0A1C7M5K4_GRIFR|nr:hypothetical protein A0H81_08396 [Grifola frondosa]